MASFDQSSLKKGDRVTIFGLIATTEHNGKSGTVVVVPRSISKDKVCRYGVQIDGVSKPMNVKISNLKLCATSHEEEDVIFCLGDAVRLHGLTAAKYNEQAGVVVATADPSNEGRVGVRLRNGECIRVRPLNITKSRSSSSSSKRSTSSLKKELDDQHRMAHLTRGEAASAEQMAFMRQMMGMCMTGEREVELFGRKIDPLPNYPEELRQAGGFPVGVNHGWASRRLRTMFEQDSALPHMFEFAFKRPEYEPSPKDIVKRLGTNDPDTLRWYFSRQAPGNINTNRKFHPYGLCVRHNFSNQAYRKEKLHQGTTHVAVGFVDLGILMAADLEGSEAPLRFLGIDQSAFAVAKTHVVWKLLQQTPSGSPERDQHLVGIMQVWFSSTWTKPTELAVKAALTSLCAEANAYHPDVLSILNHWQRASSMPLSKARNEFAASTTDGRSSVGHMKLKKDRIAMAKYEITGDFGVEGHPHCGSIVHYDCPDGTPPSALDDSVFVPLSFKDVMDVCAKKPNISIVEAAEEHALAGITKLASWCQSRRVLVELRCSPVENVIRDISALKPWTMSWSNLIDYLDYQEFHRMARECSIHGNTIHFAYSMNWPLMVSGVCLIDYAGKEMTALRASLIDAMNESNEQSYTMMGWNRRIRLPLAQNPINTVSYSLELQHYKNWIEYFFEKARQQGPCSIANMEHAIDNPLGNTGNSTVAFTWTYDPDIRFNALQEW